MIRRSLVLAAIVAAAASMATPAQAAPPYCVTVTDSSGTLVEACLIGTSCVTYGTVVPNSPFGLAWCVPWP